MWYCNIIRKFSRSIQDLTKKSFNTQVQVLNIMIQEDEGEMVLRKSRTSKHTCIYVHGASTLMSWKTASYRLSKKRKISRKGQPGPSKNIITQETDDDSSTFTVKTLNHCSNLS